MKNKDIIMFGLIIGIGLFFIGAIISNVFVSDEPELLAYKASASIKLIGLGFITTSMVIGGIIIEEIDKNLKILLLLFGLILLIVYTIGAESLQWSVSNAASESDIYEDRPQAYGLPGFEIVFSFLAMFLVLLFLKIRRNR